MPRLPIPGSDNGSWGNILNDFLLVEHKQDGSLKDVLRLDQLAAPSGIATLGDDGLVTPDQLPAAIAPPDADATTKGMLQLTGDLGGTAESPTVPALSAKANDNTVVHTTGNETIAGVKTFSSAPVVPDSSFAQSKVTNLTSDLAAKATDASVVHLAGAETITGAKDFTGGVTINATNIVVTTDTRLSNERTPTDSSVTNAKVSATAAIAQSKIANLTTDLAAKATDTAVVHLAGAETITGVKTFSSAPVVPDSSFAQSKVTNLTTDLAAKYTKPGTGIPSSDLTTAVQTSLTKADAAIPNTEKGANSGVATLDASGKLTLSQTRVQSVDGLTGTVDLSTRYSASAHNHDATYISQVAGAPEGLLVVASSGASHAINLTAANAVDLTLTANCTLSFPTVASNKAVSFTLILRQDATGNRSLTWPNSIRWADGFTPTPTTAASKVDIYSFMTVDAGTTWFGFISGQGM